MTPLRCYESRPEVEPSTHPFHIKVPDDMMPEKKTPPSELSEIKLFVSDELYRAFQRCVWVLVHETGRDQQDIMREVVLDFLVKHEC